MSSQPQPVAELLPAVVAQLAATAAAQTVQEPATGHIRDTETSDENQAVRDAHSGNNEQLRDAGVPA